MVMVFVVFSNLFCGFWVDFGRLFVGFEWMLWSLVVGGVSWLF